MYYKLGQAYITNWGSFIISNWGKCCYKSWQLFQIRATAIAKQSSFYKLGKHLLKIRAVITNQGSYYKLGHNKCYQIFKNETKNFIGFFKKIDLVESRLCSGIGCSLNMNIFRNNFHNISYITIEKLIEKIVLFKTMAPKKRIW